MGTPSFDDDRASAFAERFVGALNDGGLCLMASIVHRTGLFDTMDGMAPATSAEIAAAAGLSERYVREWLGAMVTSRVIDVVDDDRLTFRLPAEHSAFLTRAGGADNMAMFAQYIAVLGGVEDDITECFRAGGGVPYDRYPRFHTVMAEESELTVMSGLESHILPLIPGLTERLEAGIRVLDVGCGQGRVITRLAELFLNSNFVGFDLSNEAIAYGRTQADERGLSNLEFVARDLSDFHVTAPVEEFDFITTFDAEHDQAQPLRVLEVPWSSVAVSHRDNAVVVYVAAEDADKASKVLASYEPQELFRLGIEEPGVEAACTTRENCSSPMKAGIVIRKGSTTGTRCTMGFNVQVGSDEQFLTSGHCGWDGSNNWYHAGFGLIGAETATQYVNNGREAMRVQMSDAQDSNLVYNLFNPVTSARNPIQGESMCASLGVSNSHSCGIVEVSVTSWFATNCSCTMNGADASIVQIVGDSGSPYFSSQAVGIGIGSTSDGKFARLGDVLTAWGISIRS